MKRLALIICLLSSLAVACTSGQHQVANTTQRVTQEQMRETLRQHERAPRPSTTSTTCGAGACICEGVKACMDLIDSGKCRGNFHCGGGGDPICVCER